MVIDPGPDARMMDLVREITEFLEMAVPALADYQRQQDDPSATSQLRSLPSQPKKTCSGMISSMNGTKS
jgi:hypothetical protein